jgi:hypothetical protein
MSARRCQLDLPPAERCCCALKRIPTVSVDDSDLRLLEGVAVEQRAIRFANHSAALKICAAITARGLLTAQLAGVHVVGFNDSANRLVVRNRRGLLPYDLPPTVPSLVELRDPTPVRQSGAIGGEIDTEQEAKNGGVPGSMHVYR